MPDWLRRGLTIGLWPAIDWIVTAFANFMLFNFGRFPLGVVIAIASTAAFAGVLNVGYLRLLWRERWIPARLGKNAEKILRMHSKVPFLNRWKTLAVLAVYTVSGPAMAGAPLIWLLGIKGKKAYTLAVIGVSINAVVWVGGIYNVLWRFIRDVLMQLPVPNSL